MKLMAEKPEDKVIFGLVKTKYIPFAILSLTFFTYYEVNNIPIIMATIIGVIEHFYGFRFAFPQKLYFLI